MVLTVEVGCTDDILISKTDTKVTPGFDSFANLLKNQAKKT